jgi:hypothetical protein
MDLTSKTALITGSTDGVGRLVAVRMAKAGVKVLVHGRNEARAQKLLAEIRAAGGEAAFYPADLSSLADVRALAEAVRRDHDRLDILISNAGIGSGPGAAAAIAGGNARARSRRARAGVSPARLRGDEPIGRLPARALPDEQPGKRHSESLSENAALLEHKAADPLAVNALCSQGR